MKLCLTGDAILFRRLNSTSDPAIMPLFDMIRACDVAFTNLEFVPGDCEGDPVRDHGGTHFGASPWVLDELADAGFHLFAAATNHSLDYGIAGLRKAMAELDAREFLYAGIGRHLDDARRPAYMTHPAGTVSLLSCASTFARGQEAAAQTTMMQGRPGLNPLRFDTMHHVTPDEMAMLERIHARLGLREVKDAKIGLGFDFPPPPGVLAFENLNFTTGTRTVIRTEPNAGDADAIARWIAEARMVSDTVIVSVHAHESGYDEQGRIDVEVPADFLVAFAHRAIDAGADVIACHGPHLLRGMEIYRGKPVFYSLGNFIGQNELVDRLPAESYAANRLSPDLTPHYLYRARSKGDTKGFPAEPRFWETIMPICLYQDGVLRDIEIHPVSLGLGPHAHRRGVPSLAQGADADAILQRFASLSGPFGVEFDTYDQILHVRLPRA